MMKSTLLLACFVCTSLSVCLASDSTTQQEAVVRQVPQRSLPWPENVMSTKNELSSYTDEQIVQKFIDDTCEGCVYKGARDMIAEVVSHTDGRDLIISLISCFEIFQRSHNKIDKLYNDIKNVSGDTFNDIFKRCVEFAMLFSEVFKNGDKEWFAEDVGCMVTNLKQRRLKRFLSLYFYDNGRDDNARNITDCKCCKGIDDRQIINKIGGICEFLYCVLKDYAHLVIFDGFERCDEWGSPEADFTGGYKIKGLKSFGGELDVIKWRDGKCYVCEEDGRRQVIVAEWSKSSIAECLFHELTHIEYDISKTFGIKYPKKVDTVVEKICEFRGITSEEDKEDITYVISNFAADKFNKADSKCVEEFRVITGVTVLNNELVMLRSENSLRINKGNIKIRANHMGGLWLHGQHIAKPCSALVCKFLIENCYGIKNVEYVDVGQSSRWYYRMYDICEAYIGEEKGNGIQLLKECIVNDGEFDIDAKAQRNDDGEYAEFEDYLQEIDQKLSSIDYESFDRMRLWGEDKIEKKDFLCSVRDSGFGQCESNKQAGLVLKVLVDLYNNFVEEKKKKDEESLKRAYENRKRIAEEEKSYEEALKQYNDMRKKVKK